MSKKSTKNIKWEINRRISDKPRRIIDKIDSSKISELFSLSSQMNTFTLKQFSNINKIPLTISKNDGNNLIHMITSSDDETKSEKLRLNVIKFLVSEGVSPDSPNSDNNTPLHFACTKQHSRIIKYLLKQGANSNYKDNVGMTPFHYLLAGNMKLCPPSRKVKDFIPLNKKTNNFKIENLKKLKAKLWEKIKDNPILQSLRDTIVNTELPPKVNDYLSEFENKLTKALLDNDKDNFKQMKELIEPFKTEFRNWILSQFGDFKIIDNFEIHNRLPQSWSKTVRSELATIKNHDSLKYVKDEIKLAANKASQLKFEKLRESNIVSNEDIYKLVILFASEYNEQKGGGEKK